MSEETVTLIRQGYEAHRHRDFPAIFALLHPDVEIFQTEALPWGGTYHGHAEARDFFRKLGEYTDALPEPEIFIPAGDDVAVFGHLKGRARASGQEFNVPIVHLWSIREGQVVRFAAYIDTPQMLQVLPG